MANARGDSVFTLKVTGTAADQALDLVESRNFVTIIADADCYINFDDMVSASERLLIKANTVYEFHNIMVRKLHYLTAGANIYVMAWKGGWQ